MKHLDLAFTILLATPLIASAADAPPKVADAAKPNIVVIFINDMGYADIGPFFGKADANDKGYSTPIHHGKQTTFQPRDHRRLVPLPPPNRATTTGTPNLMVKEFEDGSNAVGLCNKSETEARITCRLEGAGRNHEIEQTHPPLS